MGNDVRTTTTLLCAYLQLSYQIYTLIRIYFYIFHGYVLLFKSAVKLISNICENNNPCIFLNVNASFEMKNLIMPRLYVLKKQEFIFFHRQNFDNSPVMLTKPCDVDYLHSQFTTVYYHQV